jgi:hypothetical protein
MRIAAHVAETEDHLKGAGFHDFTTGFEFCALIFFEVQITDYGYGSLTHLCASILTRIIRNLTGSFFCK